MDSDPVPQPPPNEQEKKEDVSQVLFNAMQEKLGGEHFHEHQYVTDIFKLRAEVNPLLAATDKTPALAKIRESRMWKDYNDIQKELFTPDELKQVAQLDTILKTSDITGQLKKGLLDFVKYRHELSWEKRPEGVRGDESKKKDKTERAVQHLTDVADFTEKMNVSPIATLLALVHDIEKYAGEETLLAEHEVASAVIGGEILETLFQSTDSLKDKGYDLSAYAGVIKKLARKMFTHGEFEFPALNAQPIVGEDIKTLFGGIYLNPTESRLIPIKKDRPQDAEESKGISIAQNALIQVSVADKNVGIKDIDKVLDEIAGPSGEGLKESPWETFENLSNTIIENNIGAKIVAPLDPNSEAYKDSARWKQTNLFILHLIKRADELHNKKEKDYEKIYTNAFQLELQPGEVLTDSNRKALVERLETMIFAVQMMRTASEEEKQQPVPQKNIYAKLFHSLFESLHSIRFSIVEGSDLSKSLLGFEEELTNKWISTHPALAGKREATAS